MEDPLIWKKKTTTTMTVEEGGGGGGGGGVVVVAAAEAEQKEDSPPVTTVREAWEAFVAESGRLWIIAGPIAFQILCVYGINSATQIFVGHLGNLELSAVAIALSVISNFSFGFLLGMGSALETLCGQAFGAGQIEMLGIYLQRSWIILFASACLMCPFYIFATPILKLLGQEDDIAEAAGQFTILIIPEMFSLALNFPTQKFLQAQSKVNVLAWIGFASLILHIGLLGLFVYVLEWGLTGAAIAFNISMWVVAIAQVAYVVGWCNEGWTGLSWAAFQEIWAFVRLSIASAVMLCLEIWYMMVLVVLTGHLKNAEIAVGSISICMNINGLEGMLFIGINAAISVRVSNELGSGRARACKYAVIVVVATSLVIGLLAMVLIIATRNSFSVIFTSDAEMQRAVAKIAYLLGLTMVLNSIQPVISGVAIGGGWQGLVAYINLGCYYVFGLPFGFILGYLVNWGVQVISLGVLCLSDLVLTYPFPFGDYYDAHRLDSNLLLASPFIFLIWIGFPFSMRSAVPNPIYVGIWVGMLCGTLLQTLILLFIVWKTDWKAEAAQASERVRLWGGQNETTKLEM